MWVRAIAAESTIGLVELEPDGDVTRDSATGIAIETYNTFDIKEFAKCWTGFETRPQRGNIERGGHVGTNKLDPMQLRANGYDTRRDLFPKSNLYGGHLGDGAPLCSELPTRHFLAASARWSYLGVSSTAVRQPEMMAYTTANKLNALGRNGAPRMVLDPVGSSLHAALCRRASTSRPCNFASEVELNVSLLCNGDECLVDTVAVVDVPDPVSNVTVHYEYIRRALQRPGHLSRLEPSFSPF